MGTGGSGGSDPKVCVPGVPQTTQFPRLTNRQYDNVVKHLLGLEALASGTDAGSPPSSMLNPDFEGPMNAYALTAYLGAAETVARDVMANPTLRANFISCDPAADGCLEQTVRTFGRKAWRRPLTDADVALFAQLSNTDPPGTPEEVAETTLYAFLASASFLTIAELESGTPLAEDNARPGDIKLNNYEVAARLSFLLWGSVPDDELNAAADAGQLTTKEQILAQATRMVQDEKVGPQVAKALRFWADMDNDNSHWWGTPHSQEDFPEYTAETLPSLAAEMDAFFSEVALGGGSFKDLFLSPVGFVNQHTAALYGLDPAAYGPELTPYTFPDRPGFLTRGAFLASHSHSKDTSPIWRGAYINIRIIGVDPGPPSPNALTTKAPDRVYTTNREYIEALTEPAECYGCHSKFVNPPGFVLEAFDAIGAWQTTDPLGGPINAVADVTFSATNKKTISTPAELMAEIAASQTARRNFAEKITAFASGRAPNSNDACTVEQLEAALASDSYTVLNLLTDLTQADSLRLRTRGN